MKCENRLVMCLSAGMLWVAVSLVAAAPAQAMAGQSSSGSAGYCLDFDGVNDFVGVTRTAALEPGQITVELWARLDGPQDWNARLVRKAGHFANGYTLSSDRDLDRRMQLIISKDGALVQARDTQPHTAYVGTWHHFAGVYYTDHAQFWVDGVLVSELTHNLGAMDHQPLTDLFIGAGLPSPAQNEFFDGRIDEIRIWNYPRTAAQIQANWNRTLAGGEPGLVAYWRFDEGSGQVAHDASAYGHDGQLGASPSADPSDPLWAVSDAPLQPTSAENWCLSFDGIDDLVHVLRSVPLEPDEITIELWARLDGPQDWNTRLLRKGERDAYFITADQDHDQRMQFLFTRGYDIKLQAKDTQPHTAYNGSWHHFLGLYAIDHAEFWVDGVKKAHVTHDLGALTHLPLADLYVGAGLPVTLQNEYFKGRIDEVRIWNYPRWPAEIQADWWRSLLGSEPGLVAYWRFDEGQGQVALDSSPFGNHGELGLSAAGEPSDPTWMLSDVPLGPATCGAVEYHCSPAAPNSVSAIGAVLEVLGCASHKVNDLELVVTHLPPHGLGLFLYGPSGVQLPVGNGWLCAGGTITRLGPAFVSSPTGTVVRPVDLGQPPFNGGSGQIVPGSIWHFQYWYRDPPSGLTLFNFSSSAEITFAP